MNRRRFLRTATAAVAARIASAQAGGIKIGYDTYTLRSFQWKALRHLEYCSRLKLDTLQISSLNDYESLDPGHLQQVKDLAARQSVTIDAGIGCICPTANGWNPKEGTPEQYLIKGMRVAKAVGAKSMRCFIANPQDRRGPLPVEAHIESTLKGLRAARSQALDLGVKIAIENHGDLTARETKMLIDEAGKDFVGSCLDTGNPMWLLEDPMLTLEVLAPYVVTTHIRDSVVYEHPRGAAFQWLAMGDGMLDWPRFLAYFRQHCPGVALQMEIITGRPAQLLPYLEPDYWRVFPKMPASDFARFLTLVRRGRPYAGPMVIGGAGPQPPEYEAALREQQRVDLERSLAFARRIVN